MANVSCPCWKISLYRLPLHNMLVLSAYASFDMIKANYFSYLRRRFNCLSETKFCIGLIILGPDSPSQEKDKRKAFGEVCSNFRLISFIKMKS